MSKSNVFENNLLDLIFNATAIPDLAENDTSSPLTELFVSLHTADPGEAGDQSTNEATYTSYARISVARTSGGWTVTGSVVTPTVEIAFPEAAGGTETITHFGIGTLVSGAGVLYYSGTVTPNIAVVTGVLPKLKTTSTITED